MRRGKSCRFEFTRPPPSVNAATRPGFRSKKNTPEYEAWKQHAGSELVRQIGKLPEICYWRIEVRIPAHLTKADIGNLEKQIADLLVDHGRVPDDRYCVDTRTLFTGDKKVVVFVREENLQKWLRIKNPSKSLLKRLVKSSSYTPAA